MNMWHSEGFCCRFTSSALVQHLHLDGAGNGRERPSAKNTRQRESLDSSLLQLFREVQAVEMN
jgi:hypothetical protein